MTEIQAIKLSMDMWEWLSENPDKYKVKKSVATGIYKLLKEKYEEMQTEKNMMSKWSKTSEKSLIEKNMSTIDKKTEGLLPENFKWPTIKISTKDTHTAEEKLDRIIELLEKFDKILDTIIKNENKRNNT